ncbi:MAG: AMP-binding protein [archaeon]|jgi:phenylacetate-coenzyme A ligase PaaK-like adenylate-forming protein
MAKLVIDEMNDLLSFFGGKKISSLEEWKNIPLKRKSDLVDLVPKKFLELRITSGSTGEPLYIFYSKDAIDAFLRRTIKSIRLSGVTNDDVVLNLFAYGNYVPGSMYERACLSEGIAVLPLGAPNTYPKEKIIDVVKRVKPTVWFSVPSYALAQLNILASIDKKLLPRIVVVAGERLLDSYIENFNNLGIKLVNNFGLTECPAIGVSINDQKLIKVIPDGIFVEMVNVDGNNELVITDLNNKATPIIRYNTRDLLIRVKEEKNGSLQEFEVKGRNDDLIKLQGLLVSKNKIIEVISKYTNDFYVNIIIKEGRDYLQINLLKSIKPMEKEIIFDITKVYGKVELVFLEEINPSKTSSHKVILVQDLRK